MIPQIQLAPMEGVLDWVLRELLSEVGGLDRLVTEFIRVTERTLPDHVFRRYCPELEQGGRTRAGTPVFVQLLGGQPGPMAENATRAAALGAPGIDLNFGCPAKTVNRHDGGAALLQQPRRLFEVTQMVRAATPSHLPVTAKVRLGFEHKEFCREIAQAVEEGGADHIVVHARTKREGYIPPAHWSYIAQMREGRSIPFLANGEIWSVEDFVQCQKVSGVNRVALGRGLVRRPTLAREIRGQSVDKFDRLDFLSRFVEESFRFRGEAYALARLKQILRYWSTPLPATTFAPLDMRADNQAQLWFTRAKHFTLGQQALQFVRELREESRLCKPLNFTPGLTAPTAIAPRLC